MRCSGRCHIINVLFFLMIISSCASPMKKVQQGTPGISQRAQKNYVEAQRILNYPSPEAQEKAVEILKKSVKEAPDYFEVHALLASVYNKRKNYPAAIKYFDQANEINAHKLLSIYDVYAHAAGGVGNFTKALSLINLYLKQPSLSGKSRKNAMKWEKHFRIGKELKKVQYVFHPINLGDSINSRDAEYFPNLTIDGENLVFTRKVGGRYENFFISKKKADRWRKAHPFTAIFQNDDFKGSYNKGSETISQDGKTFFFTICDREDGLGSCDIYYSKKTNSGWSKPKNIGSPINSPYWDSQPSLSPDGKDLYFVSNRPGGYGGSDIYVSHLQEDGRWGKPHNLGEKINTSGDESSPFIHADNQTLYFASNGQPGIGGTDLFFIRKKEQEDWGKTTNLGYPINTIDHDGSIFVAADGRTAYFASDRTDSRGALDLYQFELYPEARPIKTLYVQGNVYDKKTGESVTAVIDLTDLASGKTISTLQSDRDGQFLVTLPVGKSYAFNVSKKGYLFYSNHFSLPDTAKWQAFHIDISLQPFERKAQVVLENVFFDIDQYELRPESFVELDKVVALLQENPSLKIQINGYTDSTGQKEHNITLSQNRAGAVVHYLIKKGIAADRLSAKGYGSKNPIASNDTQKGRSKNRRTELEIIKSD